VGVRDFQEDGSEKIGDKEGKGVYASMLCCHEGMLPGPGEWRLNGNIVCVGVRRKMRKEAYAAQVVLFSSVGG
jgi:hypothetical protein